MKILLKLYISRIFIPIWIVQILHGWVRMQWRLSLKQKHGVRIVFSKDKLTHSKPLFENFHALNVYQINIYQHLNFMHKFINDQIPSIFSDLIKRPKHKYPTNFSQSTFYLKRYSFNSRKYSISIRGPKLWNKENSIKAN